MKRYLFLLSLVFILSCDTLEEIVHYERNDPEYAGIVLMAAQACIEDNNIFSALNSTNNFNTADFSVGQIFKIVREAEDIKNTFFVKITAIVDGTPDTMTLVMNGEGSTYDKIINYDSDSNQDIYDIVGLAACNEDYSDRWDSSGLGSFDSMNLVWKKYTETIADDAGAGDDDDDDDPEEYHEQDDTFTVDHDFPLFLSYFNASYSRTSLYDTNTSTTTKTSKMTITLINDSDNDGNYDEEDECTASPSICSFVTTGFADCTVNVNAGSADNSGYLDAIFSYTANSGTCNLIPIFGTI